LIPEEESRKEIPLKMGYFFIKKRHFWVLYFHQSQAYSLEKRGGVDNFLLIA